MRLRGDLLVARNTAGAVCWRQLARLRMGNVSTPGRFVVRALDQGASCWSIGESEAFVGGLEVEG